MNYKSLLPVIISIILFTSCGLFNKKIDTFTEDLSKDIKQKVLETAGINNEKREHLIKTGKKAKGEIMKVEDTQETFNQNPKIKMTVKVSPEDEDEFDAVILTFVSRVAIPRKGDKVTVYYDPKNKTDIIVY